MKAIFGLALAVMVALGGVAQAQSAGEKGAAPRPDRERLIGAWHLVSLGEAGPDGKMQSTAGLKGALIYTRDGHMSVQNMYPVSDSGLSNDYVLNGYEASFGSYDLDARKHTVTHHVQGSITHGLVGKSLTRAYQFSDGHLIIKPVSAQEHWRVVWEHD